MAVDSRPAVQTQSPPTAGRLQPVLTAGRLRKPPAAALKRFKQGVLRKRMEQNVTAASSLPPTAPPVQALSSQSSTSMLYSPSAAGPGSSSAQGANDSHADAASPRTGNSSAPSWQPSAPGLNATAQAEEKGPLSALPAEPRRLEAKQRLPPSSAAPGLHLRERKQATVSAAKPGRAWDGVIVAGAAVLALLMLLDSGKSYEFSVPYLLCYNIMCLRVPDVLGQWVITTVADLKMSPATTTTAISTGYMIAMQAYLIVLKFVCRNMSVPDMFPRFHFVAQMYYYLFWYMMLMVLSPGGVEDWNFWVMVGFLNGTSLASNAGFLHSICAILRPRLAVPDPPLRVVFDSKLAVQDQLADVVSLLVVPAIATSFHICTAMSTTNYPRGHLVSLWQRFGVLLVARLLSGLLTEEIFRRRMDLLNKADALELQLLPIDESQNRLRYLNDISLGGPKLALESMRNIERCEIYFAAIAVACTFAVFQKGDDPARYAFVDFG